MKKTFYTILILIIAISSYSFVSSIIGKEKFLSIKKILSRHQIETIKKIIFPYKLIAQQEKKISQQKDQISKFSPYAWEIEVKFKNENKDFTIKRKPDIELSNNKILKRYLSKRDFILE